MVSREVVINKIVEFANNKLAELSSGNPLTFIFIKPVVVRAINNNIYKLDSLLKMVQDKDGNIDVEGILSEMVDNLITAKTKTYADVLGGIELGNGTIKFNIPWSDKAIILDHNDIESFKQTLIK